MPALTLDHVTVEVAGRRILEDVNLNFEPGSRSIIIGPNGAGKSTLLRVCHGLAQPSSGSVRWHGDAHSELRQAMVFQRPVMLRRSALGNVVYALAAARVKRSERAARARAALERAGVSALAMQPARTLSGGEQQRLALARAWALHPFVLFLDEPTANLDPGASAEVERLIANIHAAGTTIIMTTHNLGQAKRLGDAIHFLHQGKLVEQARADDFFREPRSDEAKTFIRGELPWD